MPNFRPWRRQASEISRTTSPLPSFQGLFFTECSVYLLGQRQKPSWCLQVSIRPRMPAAFGRADDLVGVEGGGIENRLRLVAVAPFLVGERVRR